MKLVLKKSCPFRVASVTLFEMLISKTQGMSAYMLLYLFNYRKVVGTDDYRVIIIILTT